METRSESIASAMRRTRDRNAAEKKAKAKRREKTRPVEALELWWREQVTMYHGGVKLDLARWGKAEQAQARKLIKEHGLEAVKDATERFVAGWRGDALPPFLYFVKVRDTYLGLTVDLLKNDLNEDEFNPEAAAASPRLGW